MARLRGRPSTGGALGGCGRAARSRGEDPPGRRLPRLPRQAPYFWSDQYGSRIQFAGTAGPGTEFAIEAGSLESGSYLAIYRREGIPVAVLGVDQVRLFTRWRRQLSAPAALTTI
ncbi:oxidoreductase C-terminal domain-containing protein [Rhodococcus sp. P1Y]|uniref:oxidoreductase C-terminal domain-containing protein n=1 Tax=Rhodococcus sp. P1Y TaxID=1302308 RepID=UPI001F3AC081|nr:oxidoreductase C-terminal domain-containing protein [Rhodococcus sp. P1Y]